MESVLWMVGLVESERGAQVVDLEIEASPPRHFVRTGDVWAGRLG